ncbi:MAG: polysaccharide deacetylase family protein [Clostridiales bacterium]
MQRNLSKNTLKKMNILLVIIFVVFLISTLYVLKLNAAPFTIDNYIVDYNVQNNWGNGATVNVTLTNNGSTMQGWNVEWIFPENQQITNMWNASFSQNGSSVIVTNVSWNESIPTNGNVTFGFNITYSGSNTTPTDFIVNSESATSSAPVSVSPITTIPITTLPVTTSQVTSSPLTPNTDKLCALTFDDGPDTQLTALVLDKLDKHNVNATFFMIGQKINTSTSSIVQRVVNSGNEIGNHSWGYSSMNNMSTDEIKTSINNTTNAIQTYSGTTPKFFRPPNLSTSSLMYSSIDLPFVSGIIAYDWDQSTTAKQRADAIINSIRDGAIILLHDVQPLPHPTPEALDIIIPDLKSKGYEFVTLSELFTRKGITPSTTTEIMYVYVE